MPKKVLCVEDHSGFSQKLAEILSAYDVVLASGMHDALALLNSDDFDIVITDLYLPDGDGLQLCKSIRNAGKAIGILVLTASDHLTDEMVQSAGAQSHIQKHERGFVQKLMSEVKRLTSALAMATQSVN